MLTREMRADLGVMISASHNPFEDNGIKLFGPDGFKLSDEARPRSRRCSKSSRSSSSPAMSAAPGGSRTPAGAICTRSSNRSAATCASMGWKVVVDCANGAAYEVTPGAIWELGAEVIAMGVEPNGTNINDGVGSTSLAAIKARVVAEGADIGIALDGDADRLIVIDEKGETVDGDQIMAAIATRLHERGKLTGGGVVATVMSNLGLERYLAGIGLTLERTQVGDRLRPRTHAQRWLQRRRRTVGPHDPVRSRHHRRRHGRGVERADRSGAFGQACERIAAVFEPVPQLLKNVRYDGGACSSRTASSRRSPRPKA